MSLPAIGSLIAAGPAGRAGVVLGAQALGEARDGRQLVAITVKTSEDGGAPPVGGARLEPARPLDERPAVTGAQPALAKPRDPAAARGGEDLSAEERAAVDRLRQRDQQVRQEEQAHAAVAGDLAGPISYVYQRGPDGRQYAVGGSVPIKARVLSGDPQEAASLGARVSAAAQAATNPSGADLAAARLGYGLQARGERLELARGNGLDLQA